MKITIQVTQTIDCQDTVIARETGHVNDVPAAMKHVARHVAQVGIRLLTGEEIITKPIEEHFKD